jgi:hypothetical protein
VSLEGLVTSHFTFHGAVSESVYQTSRLVIQTSVSREEAIRFQNALCYRLTMALRPMTPGCWLTQAADTVALGHPRPKGEVYDDADRQRRREAGGARRCLGRLNLPTEQAEVDQSD